VQPVSAPVLPATSDAAAPAPSLASGPSTSDTIAPAGLQQIIESLPGSIRLLQYLLGLLVLAFLGSSWLTSARERLQAQASTPSSAGPAARPDPTTVG
jgi:hypothetical protein